MNSLMKWINHWIHWWNEFTSEFIDEMNQPVNSIMKWINQWIHEWSEFTCNSGKLENYNTDNTWNLISGRPGTLVLVSIWEVVCILDLFDGKNDFLSKCFFYLKLIFIYSPCYFYFFHTRAVGWLGFEKYGKFHTFFQTLPLGKPLKVIFIT